MTPTLIQGIWIAAIGLIGTFIMASVAFYVAWKKTPYDNNLTESQMKKVRSETEEVYQRIANSWAAQVENLQLDIDQVRRENETYRKELTQRDQIIEDLKDWAARLTRQIIEHAPHIIPEKYYRRIQDAKQPGED